MGYRLKFLVFLSVFMIGAFSIITWKAFRVYSESYSEAALQSEMDILEQRVQNIVGDFERFKSLASADNDVEAQLKALQIPLMAHVIFAEGKWKAQWFEGLGGVREQAKALAGQIAFDTVPQSRNSWSLVRFNDRSTGYAFVLPSITNSSVHFFAFFMNQKSLLQILKKNSIVESLHIVSPHAGEVYSSSVDDMRLIEGRMKDLANRNKGVLLSKNQKVILYQFHPFLQAYLFKVVPQTKVATLPLSRFYGLILLAVILCAVAVYAMHILFIALFERINVAIEKIRLSSGVEVLHGAFADEVIAIERLAEAIELQPNKTALEGVVPVPTPQISVASVSAPILESKTEELSKQMRSRVINCLGYLNRVKTQFQIDSPHMRLLEQELREMRKYIDPQASEAVTPAIQPSFNPILSTFQKQLIEDKKDVKSTKESNLEHNDASISIRRPKREINDFGDL